MGGYQKKLGALRCTTISGISDALEQIEEWRGSMVPLVIGNLTDCRHCPYFLQMEFWYFVPEVHCMKRGLIEQTNGRYIEPISIDYYQRLISFELIMSALSAISLDLLSSQTVKENKTGQCGCYLSQYAGFSSRIRLLCSIQTLSNGAGSLKSLSSFCPWSSVLDSPCKFNNAPRSNFGALSSLTFRMCTYCSG